MRLLLLTLALSACDPVPPEVGFRRVAAARLTVCIQNTGCIGDYVRACFAASEAYCLDAGYPPECGQMEPEGSCR